MTLPESVLEDLRGVLGERCSTAPSILDLHARDESSLPAALPDLVVFPESTAEVVEVVKICSRAGVPIVPWGAGTSLEGHVLAVHGGVVVDLSRMNRILAIRDEDLDATVQAGVTRRQLDRVLRERGLFFPIDPGADATFGGMVSTRASGTNAVRYGTFREATLALEVVLADGRVIRTARRARKSSAGYDLTRLFVGAEGTLGIVTEVTVRVHGLPEAMVAAVVAFPTLDAASSTVIRTIQLGIPVARIELLDSAMVDAINRYAQLDNPVRPTLMIELHGSPRVV
ncbi:MAG: FAD-binding protein, partial [Phycisphaerales bacterium]|nr:FAD-binding protein [Phycisphaerales bacterium]